MQRATIINNFVLRQTQWIVAKLRTRISLHNFFTFFDRGAFSACNVSMSLVILITFLVNLECRTSSTWTDLIVANSKLAANFCSWRIRIWSDGLAKKYAKRVHLVNVWKEYVYHSDTYPKEFLRFLQASRIPGTSVSPYYPRSQPT